MVYDYIPWHVVRVATPKIKEMEKDLEAVILNCVLHSIFAVKAL